MIALLLAAQLAATPYEDPCRAIVPGEPLPAFLRAGSAFSGPVSHVIDGDSLCIAVGKTPDKWVEVRLANFYAPEYREPRGKLARLVLSKITDDRTVKCFPTHRSYDRIVARCEINGVDLADILARAGVEEGRKAYPRHRRAFQW